MSETVPVSELYFVVLPQISLSENGKTDQILTLLPDRNFATEFFPDEVDDYLQLFSNRTKQLTGGHVTGYNCKKERTTSGRVIVRVSQNVQ